VEVLVDDRADLPPVLVSQMPQPVESSLLAGLRGEAEALAQHVEDDGGHLRRIVRQRDDVPPYLADAVERVRLRWRWAQMAEVPRPQRGYNTL
jgi:hypothetical protein